MSLAWHYEIMSEMSPLALCFMLDLRPSPVLHIASSLWFANDMVTLKAIKAGIF